VLTGGEPSSPHARNPIFETDGLPPNRFRAGCVLVVG